MVVRAKFILTEWKNHMGSRPINGKWEKCIMTSLVFEPVAGDTEENKKFWAASPFGKIELGIVNPEAVEELEILKEYYVDFTLAPRPEPEVVPDYT